MRSILYAGRSLIFNDQYVPVMETETQDNRGLLLAKMQDIQVKMYEHFTKFICSGVVPTGSMIGICGVRDTALQARVKETGGAQGTTGPRVRLQGLLVESGNSSCFMPIHTRGKMQVGSKD